MIPVRLLLLGILGILGAVSGALLPAGAAGASTGAPPARITAIEVTGAVRTLESTILNLAGVAVGDPCDAGLAARVRQNLQNAGIFYDIDVQATPAADGVRLKIALSDKWSLIPVPVVSLKSGEQSIGLGLIESNLFGRNQQLIGVVRNDRGRWSEALLFADRSVAGSRFSLMGSLRNAEQEQPVWDGEREVGSYDQRVVGATLALGYRVRPRATASLVVKSVNTRNESPDGEAQLPPDLPERALGLRLDIDGVDHDEDLRQGLRLWVEVMTSVPALGDELGRTGVRAEARWSRPLPGRQTLTAFGTGRWSTELPPGYRYRTEFLRGYELGRFQPDRLLGGSLEHQVPLKVFREARISAVGFVDAALMRDERLAFALGDARADAGLALGVYLRRVALPVLQFYTAYGFSSGRFLPGFSLGIAF